VLIRERWLPRRQRQTISFDEHAVVFGLRPSKKADKHEGSAKHQGGVGLDPDRAIPPVVICLRGVSKGSKKNPPA
jgi:hypothetical protein